MKKQINALLALTLVAGSLSLFGCNKEEPKGDEKLHMALEQDDESVQRNVDSLLSSGIVTVSGDTFLGGTTRNLKIYGDENPYIALNTKKGAFTLTYDVDETNPLIKSVTQVNENVKWIEFNFPKKGEEQTTFSFNLTKVEMVRSGTTYSTKEGEKIPYNFTVIPETYLYEDLTINDITKLNDQNSEQYAILDYSNAKSPYYPTNNPDAADDKQYLYCHVKGEIIYLAPDGNWGLIQDGDDVLEIYAGASTRPFTKAYWNGLEVGKKVRVTGNLSQYKGNMQLGFVTGIDILTDAEASSLTPATKNYAQITASQITNWTLVEPICTITRLTVTVDKAAYIAKFSNAVGQKQFAFKDNVWKTGDTQVDLNECGIQITGTAQAGDYFNVVVKNKQVLANSMNALKTVTGTIVPNTWKSGDSAATISGGFNYKTRATFQMNVDGKLVTIAYDYHVAYNKSGSPECSDPDLVNALLKTFYDELGTFATADEYVGKYVLVADGNTGKLKPLLITASNKGTKVTAGTTVAYGASQIGTTKTVTIKGTLRYNGVEKGGVFAGDAGEWQLTPFGENCITFAD